MNPLGRLPALRDGELIIREAAAIALHLADKAESKGLAPKVGTLERASYYQWVVFSVATELFALSKIAMHTRVLPEPQRVAAIAADGHAQWAEVAPVLTAGVRGKRYPLGRHLLAGGRIGRRFAVARGISRGLGALPRTCSVL